MQFTTALSLGDLVVAASFLIGVFGSALKMLSMMRRLERNMDLVLVEHEMMIVDYCKRNGIEMEHLPTRMRYWETRRSER